MKGRLSRTVAMTAAAMGSVAGVAQEPEGSRSPSRGDMDEIVVSATRSRSSIATVPGSVSVVTFDELNKQGNAALGLTDTLGKLVPGLALGSQTNSNATQGLRGRNTVVLIDGISQNPVRDGGHNLAVIDPSVIERVEVIRGATAIYGNGATGGIINIVTRDVGRGAPEFTTALGTRLSLTHPSDSIGYNLRQTMRGGLGRFGFALGAALEQTGSSFDADGDRIAPDPFAQGGLADTLSYNLFGKGQWELSPESRLRAMVNHYDSEQDTDYTTDPSVNALPLLSTKARVRKGLELEELPTTQNTLASVDYFHDALLGSSLHLQGYYRDYLTVFGTFDGRGQIGNVAQSYIVSESSGLKLEISTPLGASSGVTLLWGADAGQEETEQRVILYDNAEWVDSGGLVFRKVGDRTWVPPLEMDNVAAFAQLEWRLGDRWTLRGGGRWEQIDASVDDFVTVANNAVSGGKASFSDTVFNLGAVFQITHALNVFASFSQGYSVPDFGLVLRSAPAGSSVASLRIRPQKVDNYEIGIRGGWPTAQFSLATYYAESQLGTTAAGIGLPPVRAPERTFGAELTADWYPTEALNLGATYTWQEGKTDPNLDGIYTYLHNFRIAPPKYTAYVQYDWSQRWTNRIQATGVSDRDRLGNAPGFGTRRVGGYATLDWLSRLQLPRGDLEIGISNLLNKQYFTREAQLLRTGRNDSYYAAEGAVMTLNYRLEW